MKHSLDKMALGAQLVAASLLGTVIVHPVPSFAKEPMRVASTTKATRTDDVEARIKQLHSELRITSAQEDAWKSIAETMRSNSKTMEELRTRQTQSERTAPAPDMIHAYGNTTDAHADAIRKFASAFQPLYDSMSDAQKKTADDVFRRRVHEAARRKS